MIKCNRLSMLSFYPENWGKTLKDYTAAAGEASQKITPPHAKSAKSQQERFRKRMLDDERFIRELMGQ